MIYLIDTLRADHLGCYGYARPTSPRIDRLAAEGVRAPTRARRARGPSPAWRACSPASTRASTAPSCAPSGSRRRSSSLSERLAAAGYETALFTTNTNVTARFGFDQGFEEFHYLSRGLGRGKREHYSSSEINREVFAWLERRDRSRPFFLFVHTLDPHDPYRPAEEFRRALAPEVDVESACCARSNVLEALSPEAARLRARDAAALYDAEIAENDAAFGELVDELERRGLAETTAVLLTSDHGEEFYEHGGWKHGFTLYEEQLRVPFVLRLPGRAHAGARRRRAGRPDRRGADSPRARRPAGRARAAGAEPARRARRRCGRARGAPLFRPARAARPGARRGGAGRFQAAPRARRVDPAARPRARGALRPRAATPANART